MLLPTKHLHPRKSIISVSSTILTLIVRRITLVELWEAYQSDAQGSERISFDWFVLALDALFALGLISLDRGLIARKP
jgi:hypothetical protein